MTPKECEQIYTEAYRSVYWTAMALLQNEADAEDVVQDTFVTMLESYDTLQDKTKVVPWLKKICARKCLDLLRRTKTDTVEQEFFDNLEYVPEDFLPESIVESEERRKIIMDIIQKALSEEVRRTIILYYFDEMSTKEIADALGIAQGTVLWRLSFARNKIKKEVEKYERENDTKLHAVALPFLALLFIKEAEQVPLRPMPASLTVLSASAVASAEEAENVIAAKAAVEKGTGIIMKKLIVLIVTTILVGGIGVGIFFATRDKEDSSKEKRKKAGEEITVTVTEAPDEPEEPDIWSDEYWLAKMYLVDVNDEAALRKIADVLMTCEPKLGDDRSIMYDKVVNAIGQEPMEAGCFTQGMTFRYEFSMEHGFSGYDRLFYLGYMGYYTEPTSDIDDPAKVLAYKDDINNPTRKGSGAIVLKIYNEARAQKAYQFYCDYITEYYAAFNPPVEVIGNNYFLKCGDRGAEYYAYARLLHQDENDYWTVCMANCFADPDLMAAYEELLGEKSEKEE